MTLHEELIRRNNAKVTGNPNASEAMVFVHGFGTDRRAWAEVAECLHEQIKGSRLSVINATGHLPHVSAAHEVIAAMRALLG